MKKIKIVNMHFFIIGCLIFNTTFAYSEEVLTWQECVGRAKTEHPDLAAAGEGVKQAKADKNIDLGAMLPQVDTDVDASRAKAATGKITETYSYSISGRQLLFDGFKTLSELKSALETIKAEQYNYSVVSSNVRLDLRNSFVGLMKAQELIDITEKIAQRRKQNLELVKLRYESGREHRGALLTAEADMAQAEFEVSQAQRGIILAQRELCKALGLSQLSALKAEGGFLLEGTYNSKPDFALLAEATPFLKELVIKKEAARYSLHSRQADFFPQVYADGSLGRTAADWPPENRVWSAGLSVSLPLFEGGSRIAEVVKAKSQWERGRGHREKRP